MVISARGMALAQRAHQLELLTFSFLWILEKESWSFQQAAWPLRKELTGLSFSRFRISGEPEGDQPPAS